MKKNKITLLPFTEKDFNRFKSWVKNAEGLFQFAGSIFSFPLTDDQLLAYLNMDDKRPFKVVLTETNEVVGHCEMNLENANHRISRVLVGEVSQRGKNLGEAIIRALVDEFFKDKTLNMVDLNTFDWNIAAIKCYEKVGFKINPTMTEEIDVEGKTWVKINMVLKREDYEPS